MRRQSAEPDHDVPAHRHMAGPVLAERGFHRRRLLGRLPHVRARMGAEGNTLVHRRREAVLDRQHDPANSDVPHPQHRGRRRHAGRARRDHRVSPISFHRLCARLLPRHARPVLPGDRGRTRPRVRRAKGQPLQDRFRGDAHRVSVHRLRVRRVERRSPRLGKSRARHDERPQERPRRLCGRPERAHPAVARKTREGLVRRETGLRRLKRDGRRPENPLVIRIHGPADPHDRSRRAPPHRSHPARVGGGARKGLRDRRVR